MKQEVICDASVAAVISGGGAQFAALKTGLTEVILVWVILEIAFILASLILQIWSI